MAEHPADRRQMTSSSLHPTVYRFLDASVDLPGSLSLAQALAAVSSNRRVGQAAQIEQAGARPTELTGVRVGHML